MQQPLTNSRTKFVVLASESSAGWTDPTVQKLVDVNVWEQNAFATYVSFGPEPA